MSKRSLNVHVDVGDCKTNPRTFIPNDKVFPSRDITTLVWRASVIVRIFIWSYNMVGQSYMSSHLVLAPSLHLRTSHPISPASTVTYQCYLCSPVRKTIKVRWLTFLTYFLLQLFSWVILTGRSVLTSDDYPGEFHEISLVQAEPRSIYRYSNAPPYCKEPRYQISVPLYLFRACTHSVPEAQSFYKLPPLRFTS